MGAASHLSVKSKSSTRGSMQHMSVRTRGGIGLGAGHSFSCSSSATSGCAANCVEGNMYILGAWLQNPVGSGCNSTAQKRLIRNGVSNTTETAADNFPGDCVFEDFTEMELDVYTKVYDWGQPDDNMTRGGETYYYMTASPANLTSPTDCSWKTCSSSDDSTCAACDTTDSTYPDNCNAKICNMPYGQNMSTGIASGCTAAFRLDLSNS